MAGTAAAPGGLGAAPPAYYSFADIAEDCGLKHAQILVLLLHLGVSWEFLGNQHRVMVEDYRRVRRKLKEAGAAVARYAAESSGPGRPGRKPGRGKVAV